VVLLETPTGAVTAKFNASADPRGGHHAVRLMAGMPAASRTRLWPLRFGGQMSTSSFSTM